MFRSGRCTSVASFHWKRNTSLAVSCFQEVPTLKDIFRVGDGIPCRIVSAESKGTKRFVEVSAKPSDVNRTLPLQALKAGCVSIACVTVSPAVNSLAAAVNSLAVCLWALLVSLLVQQLTVWPCLWVLLVSLSVLQLTVWLCDWEYCLCHCQSCS